MTEWKTPASEEEWEVEETGRQPVWVRAGGWLLRALWGFLAGNALATLYFAFAVASVPHRANNAALFVVLIGMAVYPLMVGCATLTWLAASILVPRFQRQVVQAAASLAFCGFVAVAVYAMDPLAARHRNLREELARPQTEAHPDPKVAARNAELERRERDNAYGDYVPRAKPVPAPYVPKVEPRKAEDDYSKVPEIHVSRPNGDVLLTNHSTQVLRISAALMAPAGSRASGCAELQAPGGSATGDSVVLKPRQAITLRRRDACAGTETAAVQLQVWNDQQQATPFRLIHER